ncbi:MAG: hypothetical protein LBQ62_07080 [Candidatus Accumulibacter sp.]|nr:hypothetical protein [Accumulibacter sp.]
MNSRQNAATRILFVAAFISAGWRVKASAKNMPAAAPPAANPAMSAPRLPCDENSEPGNARMKQAAKQAPHH